MDIGLNITDNIRIRLGENIEKLQLELDENQIRYNVPYKDTKEGLTREIMIIESFGVELNTSDNNITFIKTSNSKLNYIMHIEESKPLDALNSIKYNLAKLFMCEPDRIRVDTFDIKSFSSVMSIPFRSGAMAKMTLVMGANKNIYLETIKTINK